MMKRPVDRITPNISKETRVIDLGCGQGDTLRRMPKTFNKAGVDWQKPSGDVLDFDFHQRNLDDLTNNPLPFDDGSFDLVVSEHVLEHLQNPLSYFSEIVRLCRVGGYIVIVAPSDRSLWLSSFGSQKTNLILSFYDDPTHIGRPYTPQALQRMGRYHGLNVKEVGYLRDPKKTWQLPLNLWRYLTKKDDDDQFVDNYWQAIGWECYAIYQKTRNSHAQMSYFSLKGLPRLHITGYNKP